MKLSKLAKTIFNDILSHGGEVYVVGGSVRDMLMKRHDSHDVDVEVYHLNYDQLYDVLSQYGNVNTYGKSFAIMSVDTLHGYDFALPRSERKTGNAHTDFEVMIDSELPKELAIQRRDLTINALMYDYQNKTIIDLCHGIDDIKNKVIRCVNPKTFVEDPLRVLRIAQFVARFEMSVEEETLKLCKTMVKEGMLEHLSDERVYGEYCKILMSNRPSLGFEFLKEIGGLPSYLYDLTLTHQRPDYHPEGDVFEHTMLVLDVAALMKQKTDDPLSFMWSCLLHDIGKPIVTTSEGSAPYHSAKGVEVFKDIKLIRSKKQRTYIETMIMYHMNLMVMSRKNAPDHRYLRILKMIEGKVSLNDLILISCCDKLGRGKVVYDQYYKFWDYINDKIERLGTKPPEALVGGLDLINAGFKNKNVFSEMLEEAYNMQLLGDDKETILRSLKNTYEQG